MNIEGLCEVLTKYLGTEVTVGPKRGAKAVRDHAPLPSSESQMKATLAIESSDSPGRPHVHRVYNATINKLVTTISTEQVAMCGLKLEAFKGAETYPWDVLAKLRNKFYTEEFQKDLRLAGFALADINTVKKINSQAADVAYMGFEVTYAEVIAGNPEQDWIQKATGTGTVTGTVTPTSVTFDSSD